MSAHTALRTPLARLLRRTNPRSSVRQIHRLPIRSRPAPRTQPSVGQFRSASVLAKSKTFVRSYPIASFFAATCILIGFYGIVEANNYYQNYILAAFHNYPEPVAIKLRRALYFTNTDLQPKEAIKYYRQALEVAEELGMDPFSDEIMGVKIQVASLMERVQQWEKAIQVLEILRRDTTQWMEEFGGLEKNLMKRTRVLQKLVGINVKLGELYGRPEIYDRDRAEMRLVWAVETVLQERQRRDRNKVDDAVEGSWMSDEEIGASMEALAHVYEEQDQHYLATPLFLQALSLLGTGSCHSVVLMNNLASSLAQQSPRAAAAAQAFAQSTTIQTNPPNPPPSRGAMVENARLWAQKALDVAANITPPTRDEECDIGCAVATHNLGEFAEMQKNLVEARKRYEEAIGLSRAIGFEDGVENSSARLRKLNGTV